MLKHLRFSKRIAPAMIVVLILVMALMLRLRGVTFGLPALYDVDEPIFILCSLKLWRDHSLNPGWFGHPGSTTIYVMAAIEAGILLVGSLSGQFPNQAAFVDAIYHDPGLLILPARLFIVGCGVTCVWLIFLIGQRAFGTRTGLLAAGFLAINAVHIEWSQIVRTDVHAGVFMLGCIWFALGIAKRGRLRDYVGAGVMVGLACATKWPAATVVSAMIGASLVRMTADHGAARRHLMLLIMALVIALLSTLLASPYLLLDYPTVIADVTGEAQEGHLGANGGDFLFNLAWYIAHPLRDSFGVAGLALIIGGIAMAFRAGRATIMTVLVPTGIFLATVCTQHLIWARWIVPILPLIALLIAAATMALVDFVRRYLRPPLALLMTAILCAIVVAPMAAATRNLAAERETDTRALASRWILANVPRNNTIAVEHFAFNLTQAGYPILFPVGRAGCMNAMGLLSGRVSYKQVGRLRGSAAVADFGTVAENALASCRADVVLVNDLDRYLAERDRYPQAIKAYRVILAGARPAAVFRPIMGQIGGPVVRIYRLDLHQSVAARH